MSELADEVSNGIQTAFDSGVKAGRCAERCRMIEWAKTADTLDLLAVARYLRECKEDV